MVDTIYERQDLVMDKRNGRIGRVIAQSSAPVKGLDPYILVSFSSGAPIWMEVKNLEKLDERLGS